MIERFKSQELAVTFPRVMAVWWLVAWRSAVGGAVIGVVAGILLFILGAFLDFSSELHLISVVIAVVIGILWGFAVTGMALRKQYSGFRLALVAIPQRP